MHCHKGTFRVHNIRPFNSDGAIAVMIPNMLPPLRMHVTSVLNLQVGDTLFNISRWYIIVITVTS